MDEHPYDAVRCPTGDDANSCPGPLDFEVTSSPEAGEYLVVWRALYVPEPAHAALYARRYDARTGEPRTGPVRLFGLVGGSATFLTTYDAAAHQYVMVSQDSRLDQARSQPRVEVRRFANTLRPAGPVRSLGSWELTDLVAEPSGRIAVVGVENNAAAGRPGVQPGRRVTLRVETLDARNASVGVERRSGRRGEDLAFFARGAYEALRGRLLVAWTTSADLGEVPAPRFERFDVLRRGRAGAAVAQTGHSDQAVEFTCDPRLGRCLIVYPGPRVGGLLDTRGQFVDGRARSVGRPFRIASGTRGAVGAGSSGSAFSVGWYRGAITGPRTSHLVEARVDPRRRLTITDRYDLAGDAHIGRLLPERSRLLVWRERRGHNSSELRARLAR